MAQLPFWLQSLDEVFHETLPQQATAQWDRGLSKAVSRAPDLEAARSLFCAYLALKNIENVRDLDLPVRTQRDLLNALFNVMFAEEDIAANHFDPAAYLNIKNRALSAGRSAGQVRGKVRRQAMRAAWAGVWAMSEIDSSVKASLLMTTESADSEAFAKHSKALLKLLLSKRRIQRLDSLLLSH